MWTRSHDPSRNGIRIHVDAGEAVFKACSGPKLAVRYESLLREPAKHLDRIASFCGLEPSEAQARAEWAFAFARDRGGGVPVSGDSGQGSGWRPGRISSENEPCVANPSYPLTVWANPSKLEAFGLFFAAVEEHAGAAELPHGPLFGVSDFAVFHGMAAEAGFRDSSVRELQIAWVMPSIDSFLAAFRDWANLEVFPGDVRQAIESTVRERADVYRRGDAFTIPNPAILVSAVK